MITTTTWRLNFKVKPRNRVTSAGIILLFGAEGRVEAVVVFTQHNTQYNVVSGSTIRFRLLSINTSDTRCEKYEYKNDFFFFFI